MGIDIVIIGMGYVGKAMFNLLKDHYNIATKDNSRAYKLWKKGDVHGVDDYADVDHEYDIANKAKLAIVCVPTQMNPDGSCDTSIVEEVVMKLKIPVLVKSTVPPGTIEELNSKRVEPDVCFSPEYIGEGKYEVKYWKGHPHPTNAKLHDFMIVGGKRKWTNYIVDMFSHVYGPSITYAQTDSRTAEFVKYFENVWGAAKVTFMNEMFECAKQLGVDYREARELWALDGRVEKMHSVVFPDKRGWSGKCYPKDLMAFIRAVQKAGYNPEFLKEVVNSNSRFSQDEKMQQLKDIL